MAYELWETASNNLVGNYPTQEAALAAVRLCDADYGSGFVRGLALLYADEEDSVRGIAKGKELARLACERTERSTT